MARSNSLFTFTSSFVLLCFVPLHLLLITSSVNALNVGLLSSQVTNSSSTESCSRKCESDYCSVAPLLKYGKYCGLMYSGCPGEKPCDGLDSCCKVHDECVQSKNNDYLSHGCNQKFLECIFKFRHSKKKTFKGNTCRVKEVVDVISTTIEAALVTGRILHRP